MWWIVILVIVAIIVIKIASEANENANRVTAQGGMKIKYRALVNYVLSGDANARIVRESANCIDIGAISSGGQTLVCITHINDIVRIEWKAESPIFGKHKLKWEFGEFMDQNEMIEKIEHDLGIYQSNMMQKYM